MVKKPMQTKRRKAFAKRRNTVKRKQRGGVQKYVLFDVNLNPASQLHLSSAQIAANKTVIKQWFKRKIQFLKTIGSFAIIQPKDNIKHMSGRTFKLYYEIDADNNANDDDIDLELEYIMDVDDDCNSPIILNNIQYCVNGILL